MPDVIGDDSGFPKRCFKLTTGGGSKREPKITRIICIVWLQWPTFFWRYGPGPGPEINHSIEGVDPEVMRELEIVDTMRWLSSRGSKALAKDFAPIAERRLAAIQKKLPEGLTLESEPH